MKALADIAGFLHEEFGFDEACPGPSTLQRIVSARCASAGATDASGYLALLRRSPEERKALLEAVIVPETFFFRHPESFHALLSWVKARNRYPVRILSAACSTGEEAYSLAMALQDGGLHPGQFLIEGCDVSEASLEEARRAVYTPKAFRSADLEWRDRYFSRVPEGWQARSELRGLVRFRRDNFFGWKGRESWDVVFCRNVLIYFSPARQTEAIALIDRILAHDGVAFLGPAEPPLFLAHGWRAADHAMSFSCVRARPVSAPVRPPAPPARARVLESALKRAASSGTARARAPESPVQPAPPLEAARIFADGGLLDEAESLLAEIVSAEPGNPEAHFLSGVVAEARGFDDRAEAHYRKSLYAAPDHVGALEHMALLLRRRGRTQAAENLIRRAARHAPQP